MKSYKDITPQATLNARSTARLVDVREAHELASDGFITGVEHVPLAKVATKAADWKKDDTIIVICRSGNRSGHAANLLASRGFHKVLNMSGGMLAYAAAGLPVARS